MTFSHILTLLKDLKWVLYTTIYNDTYQTSQRLLGFGINVEKFNFHFENDYDPLKLLGDYGDRYRT
ncbi:hypothetical protein Xen7305DRAFT_00040370, partial [Xenococcus sp. PCC 7305]|uniref:hypothetical protein n=1 Tax=Xenococcus sp. PCC 7305 TaxID=102125 RepID=UPI0002AC0176